jgi:tripartite-type tricarboxylate transporter receptor subunit TctC
MKKTTVLAWACALGATLSAGASHAQGWPERPVRVVVPAPAGSSLDIIVRTLEPKLVERWKQPLVVENKAGAGGMLGMDVVAKAAPDGHTLGIGFNGPIAFGPFMYKKMPYDPGKDLLPIVLTTSQPNVLAVAAANPAKTLPEFIAWAKTQGDKLSYGSVGNGSSSHLTMELFKVDTGINAVHVPYSGSPPAATSLAAGETQMLFAVAPALLPLVQAGKVKFLAATSLQRSESLKDVPTVAEAGYPGFEALAWNGLFTAAGTPATVVERINADVNAALNDADVRAALVKQGLIVGGGSAAEFKAFIDRDSKKWGAIIEKVGIKID